MYFWKLSTLLTTKTTGLWERRSISATLESASTNPDVYKRQVDQRVLLAEGILQLADFAVSDDSALIQRILIAAAGLRRNPKALYALTLGQIFPQRNIADLGGGLL